MRHQVVLEGFIEDPAVPRRVTLDALPYTVGRDFTCPLQLNTRRVSRLHAQFDEIEGQLCVRDLHSTNGTFVNHERITEPTPIRHGDVMHIGEHEFRVLEMDQADPGASDAFTTMIGLSPLSSHFPMQSREFAELLAQGLVQGYAQVIVDQKGQGVGYELLGRSTHPTLQHGPVTLFTLAHALNEEIALSELFRRQSLADASRMKMPLPLYFNTHPKECQDVDRLLRELDTLRQRYPDLSLVCEIHEAAVTDLKRMAEIRSGLHALDIGLAYDDFGAGQARLLELVEVPPDVLKFDYALISGLSSPKAVTFRLVETLTALVQEMGIKTLAEGIETAAVAKTCMALGIDYFQGYFYGKPAPISPSPETAQASTKPLDTATPAWTDQVVPC